MLGLAPEVEQEIGLVVLLEQLGAVWLSVLVSALAADKKTFVAFGNLGGACHWASQTSPAQLQQKIKNCIQGSLRHGLSGAFKSYQANAIWVDCHASSTLKWIDMQPPANATGALVTGQKHALTKTFIFQNVRENKLFRDSLADMQTAEGPKCLFLHEITDRIASYCQEL